MLRDALRRNPEMFDECRTEVVGVPVADKVGGDTDMAARGFQQLIGFIHPDGQQYAIGRVVKKMAEQLLQFELIRPHPSGQDFHRGRRAEFSEKNIAGSGRDDFILRVEAGGALTFILEKRVEFGRQYRQRLCMPE